MQQDWQADELDPHAAIAGKPRRLWHRLLLVGVALLVVVCLIVFIRHVATGRPDDTPAADPTEFTETIVIPIRDGRCDLGRALGDVADRLALDGWTLRRILPENGDPALLEKLADDSGGMVRFTRREDRLELRIDRLAMQRESIRIRGLLRTFMEEQFPEDAARMGALFGLRVHRPDGDPRRPEDADLPAEVIVLVHGLDDAGSLWNALIPELLAAGASPAELRYPNDQAVHDSAAFLAAELTKLKTGGVRTVQLVGHSMGGLVCRELLTSPDFYAGNGAGRDGLPQVTRLIMVGTPNHGSEIARLRFAAETRDVFTHALSGDGVIFGTIWDGTGEAKFDLLPGSPFLRALNARPLPADVALTIIAGRASPVAKTEIDKLLERLPGRDKETADAALREVVDGVGDGCVSIASTRLPGVADHVVVAGNHLTMLRRIAPGYPAMPLAVPVIMDRLGLRRQRAAR